MQISDLEQFIVRAKAATYAGSGAAEPESRPGTVDLAYAEGDYGYLDSYAGGSDFLGREVVTFEGQPVWALGYYGYLVRPEVIDAGRAGQVIKASLAEMYREGRFLGGYRATQGEDVYVDTSVGAVARFEGKEWIERSGERVYELVYHGGLIRP
ncbi:DUF5680 domain-containing protein [Cellulomonas chengniuliangii]|uniref:DUF5680 domain-containing protein n=1 Tax=Cellulomonas chengniuliangii TaxID=2968084 RepID=UPI001D0E8E1B|nr:DUF5680 domain-containing protein [Cellulomonas chengniuliangii]MCC2317277.1 DUF5680 domain-containing protein [Cellulomonas chengniuliangii]